MPPLRSGDQVLTLWVIYDHPVDEPEAFVARRWVILDGGAAATRETMTEPDVATLRKYFRMEGLSRIARLPNDDPKIMEVWL